MKLSENFSINSNDYASQGNGILGIRDAGKTYTAIKAAEELMDAGIPIIVYDPVGVWKNLKLGNGKHKGYPVVVAGGEGSDIRLTPHNAVDIVRAAMKENVSLVIDLYSPELINKSTWIRIVQETVDVLMYENKAHNLRHIFLEEAAEFIPQRLQPQHSKVYGSLERLARMGRNARLGMTIINQRAEEVNKAILEICAMVLLHKQVGKNSLKSIQQWLELRQLDKVPEIVKSLPTLKQGECWAIGMTDQPMRIQVSSRNTFHPDPKNDAQPINKKSVIDVSGFVAKLNKALEKDDRPKEAIKKNDANEKLAEWGKERIAFLESELKRVQKIADTCFSALKSVNDLTTKVIDLPGQPHEITQPRVQITPVPREHTPVRQAKHSVGSLGKAAKAIAIFLATFPDRSFSKAQVAVATGYSVTSGGFNNSLSELNSYGLILRSDGRIMIIRVANLEDFTGPFTPQRYSAHSFSDKLGKCEREIYEVLLKKPAQGFTKEDIAQLTDTAYSPTSGGFNNSLSRLSTLELIVRDRGLIKLNPELQELL